MPVGTTSALSQSVQFGDSPDRSSIPRSGQASIAALCSSDMFTFAGAGPAVPRAEIGCDMRHFEEDFFNALYFIPASVSVDSVAIETRVPVQVWNAFRFTRQLSAIELTAFEGITFEGPEPPTILQPLQLVDYDLVFSPAGPAEIDAQAVLNTIEGDFAALTVSGARSTQLFLLPNWRETVTRTYSFLTDIATGRSQRETRRQLRGTPRISLSYTHTGFFFRIQKILRFYQNNPDLITVIPDWPSSALLAVPTSEGGSGFTVAEGRPWLVPGQSVFVHIGGQKNEDADFFLTTIDSVDNNSFTVQAASPRDWPVGTTVYRALNGRISANTTANLLTNNLAEVTINFVADPGQENLYEPGVADFNFQGRELFNIEESWADSQSLSFIKDRIVNDVGRGRLQEISFFEYTPEVLQLNFAQFSLDEVFALERFFLRQRGRAGEFWRSARLPDFELAMPIQSGQTSIEVEGADVLDIYGEDPSRAAIELELVDGRRFQRAILAFDSLTGVDTTIINFNETWPEDIPLRAVRRVSWLNVWRLTSDDLVVEWTTDSVATINLSMRSLVVEPLDVLPE